MIDFAIREILPQQGRMMLLDKVIEFDDNLMISELRVRNDGLFGDDNAVPAWLGIEYMAQTIAAHTGLLDKIAKRPITMGLLLGTRRYLSNIDQFKVGTLLRVSVEKIIQDQGLGVYDCRISGATVAISAKLNVFQTDSSITQNER